MAKLVMVQGDGPKWLIDLEKNPDIKERIDSGELRVVEELDELPPDPWAPVKKATPKKLRPAKADDSGAKANDDTGSETDGDEKPPEVPEDPFAGADGV